MLMSLGILMPFLRFIGKNSQKNDSKESEWLNPSPQTLICLAPFKLHSTFIMFMFHSLHNTPESQYYNMVYPGKCQVSHKPIPHQLSGNKNSKFFKHRLTLFFQETPKRNNFWTSFRFRSEYWILNYREWIQSSIRTIFYELYACPPTYINIPILCIHLKNNACMFSHASHQTPRHIIKTSRPPVYYFFHWNRGIPISFERKNIHFSKHVLILVPIFSCYKLPNLK